MNRIANRIDDNQIFLSVKKKSVGGFEEPKLGKPEDLKKEKGNEPKEDKISQDEMIVLEEYAKYLPSGKRQLKLNIPELRNTVLANDLMAISGTKTSGLNQGGNLSLKGGFPKDQKEYIFSIKNKNKLPQNPNPTSFKNDFKL